MTHAPPNFAIIDDDKQVLNGLRELLESVGYVARTYHSPSSFLSGEDLSACDCVITDIIMPSMNGFELEQAVRRQHPGMPMILMTGRDDIKDRGFAGAEDYRIFLRKPLNTRLLMQAIKRLLAFG
ncbi:response regulator transcription factor [Phyllobacterium bourgognense]|uniref:Response regulator receiver domain-containing protein n=1 Tax=Phyllobacterium bourgognense TaxID=314236 RepID=A0A368YRX5_9HYPH|nr:response regulator [Phyllobacterium bourgognense]RCW82338.1 response regulator receiver domain-containing protein [Phyllobacterium bourgognense]